MDTHKQEAIDAMVMPSMRRPGAYLAGIIQIRVTGACHRRCIGCAQGCNLKQDDGHISLEHFERAVLSLRDYFGVVGVFGGNPCLHPRFPDLCEVLRQYIPKRRRGLWSNRMFGHGDVCRETFDPSICNLNVHLDQDAYDEFVRDWPEANAFGLESDSRHSPPFVAMQDLIADSARVWGLIRDCDINRNWSAMIGVFRGELRGYFCEVAGAQAILHQYEAGYPDTGVAVGEGWWRKGTSAFSCQIEQHCPACGVPLRGRGELACSDRGIEQTSATHASIFHPRDSRRVVQLVTNLKQVQINPRRFTDYLLDTRY